MADDKEPDWDAPGPAGAEHLTLGEALAELGCHPALIAILSPLGSREHAVVATRSTAKTGGFLLSGGVGQQAAVYLGTNRLFVALTPDEAHRVAVHTPGTVVERKNSTTLHLKVLAQDISNEKERVRLREAIVTAFDLSLEREAPDRGLGQRGLARPSGPSCPACGVELPVTLVCDDHGPA